MRVAFLNPHSLRYYGGGEKWIIWVSNKLVELGHHVEVFALKYSPTGEYRIDNNSLQDLVKFKYQELDFKKGTLNPLRMKQIPTIEADILYVTGGYYGFLTQAFHVKAIKVYGFHDPSLQNPENFLQKRILRNIIPRFDLVHTLNDFQTKLLGTSEKICQIENTYLYPLPVCREKFDKFTILFYGQHEKSKGIDVVQNIIDTIPDDIDFFIAGSGSESISSHSKDNVRILGFVDEKTLSEMLCKVHAVFFPSRSEASSLVALESLAHCTPIIYRDIPQNSMLHAIPLCVSAERDEDFLDLVMQLKKMYISDAQGYVNLCNTLPKFLMPSVEYMQKFLDMFTTLLQEKKRSQNQKS